MPTYEYKCGECGNYFEVRATIEEKTKGLDIACGRCGSRKLEQVFGGFSLLTNRKVGGIRRNPNRGGGCCGPGCDCN